MDFAKDIGQSIVSDAEGCRDFLHEHLAKFIFETAKDDQLQTMDDDYPWEPTYSVIDRLDTSWDDYEWTRWAAQERKKNDKGR